MSSSSETGAETVTGWPLGRLVGYWCASRGGLILLLTMVLFTGPASWPVRVVMLALTAAGGVGVTMAARALLRRAVWELPGGMLALRRSKGLTVAVALADAVLAVAVVAFIRSGPLSQAWPITVWYPGTTLVLAVGVALLGLGFVRARAGSLVGLSPATVSVVAFTHLIGAGLAFWEAIQRGPVDWLPGQLLAVPLVLGFAVVLYMLAIRLETMRLSAAE